LRIYKNSLAGIVKKSGFALPTVLISSVIMLSVLAFAAASSSTVSTNLDDQYYNQLAQAAGDAGAAYAKACLAANGGTLWSSDKSLRPDTDCLGNQLPPASCPTLATNPCHFVMLNGNYFATFKVDYPSSGNASDIVSSGSTGLLRSSDINAGIVSNPWRQYNQSVHPDITSISAISNITGSTTIGSELTAGSIIPSGATVSYQWQRASLLTGSYDDIAGATSNKYTLTTVDSNKYIKVKVTGTGRYSGSIATSAALEIVTPCAASGGVVTDIGGYRIHTFTNIGSFIFTPTSSCNIELLVVAGGGGGGGAMGGGGGAGGLLYRASLSITARAYSLSVGKGGAGGSGTSFGGANGDPSSFDTLSASGGGGGGYYTGSANSGMAGGSGGGGGGYMSGAGGANISGQGNIGGAGNATFIAGGGGGAGSSGQAGQSQAAGSGGLGITNPISGSIYGQNVSGNYYLAGGGGGGGYYGITCTGGIGGSGGGGAGTCLSSGSGIAGTPNTGGGGGGGGYASGIGGAGGSGIVIIRYKI
jgi:hypothetical protein